MWGLAVSPHHERWATTFLWNFPKGFSKNNCPADSLVSEMRAACISPQSLKGAPTAHTETQPGHLRCWLCKNEPASGEWMCLLMIFGFMVHRCFPLFLNSHYLLMACTSKSACNTVCNLQKWAALVTGGDQSQEKAMQPCLFFFLNLWKAGWFQDEKSDMWDEWWERIGSGSL